MHAKRRHPCCSHHFILRLCQSKRAKWIVGCESIWFASETAGETLVRPPCLHLCVLEHAHVMLKVALKCCQQPSRLARSYHRRRIFLASLTVRGGHRPKISSQAIRLTDRCQNTEPSAHFAGHKAQPFSPPLSLIMSENQCVRRAQTRKHLRRPYG